MPSEDKLIFKYRTGYRGAPVLPVAEIAKKIKSSPASVSNRAMKIAVKIKDIIGMQ